MTRNVSNSRQTEPPRTLCLRHIVAAHKKLGNVPDAVLDKLRKTHPDLVGIRVEKNAPVIGGFSPEEDTLAVSTADPAVMAHEMAHAVNLRHSVLYRKLLTLTNALARVNTRISAPVAGLIQTLVADRKKRNDYLNTMSGISAMLAAPRLVEELNASSQALRWLENDPEAAAKMRYALGAYAQQALTPISVYQSARDGLSA